MRLTTGSAHTNPVTRLIASVSHWLHGPRQPAVIPKQPRPYVIRKRSLPDTFTKADWQRALEYWDYRCAVCNRPRGLWHTLTADHWIPLNSPDCPGTVSTNLIPLCHGQDGCNNSKSGTNPDVWLDKKFGKRKAAEKRAEIEAYFAWTAQFQGESTTLLCPGCEQDALEWIEGAPDEPGWWQCAACGGEWVEQP
ncbi:MAG: hypothetical protein IT324_20525 [Anaerolineae bacterium]|nr:hypothetical protein [Anaerolineae bacterium]